MARGGWLNSHDTLYSRYLLCISVYNPFKGLLGGVKQLGYHPRGFPTIFTMKLDFVEQPLPTSNFSVPTSTLARIVFLRPVCTFTTLNQFQRFLPSWIRKWNIFLHLQPTYTQTLKGYGIFTYIYHKQLTKCR